MLHEEPETSRSIVFTHDFAHTADTYGVPEEYTGANLVGAIIGFLVTGIFMVFAIIMLINDEIKRHKEFAQKISDDKRKLKSIYNVDQNQLDAWEREFEEKDKLVMTKEARQAEREKLAEIN